MTSPSKTRGGPGLTASPAQTTVMEALGDAKAPLTVQELAEITGLRPGQVSRALASCRQRREASLDRVGGENVWSVVR
jgi:DNA-binding MarR family transcriptional regulator